MAQDMLPRGTRLGRYEIREMLGQGGMGQVYRAWDSVLKRDVAVKVLGTPDEGLLARFAREAEAISQLDHANVVTIHDFQADPAMPCIVMEYLQGEDLSSRLRRGPLPVGEAVDVILSVCSAVHACHALGIIHRDLKPGNVFLHRTVEFGVVVKVLDFGVAMLQQAIAEGITQPGHVVGTPRYLSPEQVEHKEADSRSDQYAIGHLLYTVLVGKSPFAEIQGLGLVRAILGSEYPRLREVRPDLPARLVDAIERAMSVSPGRRYPSVLAFGQAVMGHAADKERIPPDLLSAPGTGESPSHVDDEYSRTKVDVRAETGVRQSGIDAAAAAAAATLDGDDSRSVGGPKVVPIAPFQVMPMVSTTVRLPAETAVDVSFAGGRHSSAPVPRAPAPLARERAVDDGGPRTAQRAGLGRGRLLVVAALLLVALVALVAVIALHT
jgi:serine/threonine protein kinase